MAVRVAVVGRQFGKRVLAPALEKAGAKVVAIGGSGRWNDLIDCPDVDAVAVAVPGAAQKAVALRALRLGKGLFLEKPLAESLASAKAIAAAVRRSRRPCAVDFEFPETYAWRAAKAFSPRLGRLRHAVVVWQIETYANIHRTSNWKRVAARGGGTLNNFGCHVFHNVEWLFGPIKEVSARLRQDGPGDTSCEMMLGLASGASVAVALAADAFKGAGHRVEAYGSEGSFVLDNPHADYMTGWSLKTATRRSPEWKTVVQGRAARPGEDGRIVPISRLARRWVSSFRSKKRASPGISDGLRSQVLIDAALRSDRLGRAVKVPRG